MKNILKNERIEVLIPKYEENMGNCTKVITDNDEILVHKSIKSCINNLADDYNINLRSIRKNYGKELGIKNKVPIIINYYMIYVPFKARKPLCKNDTASGYININYIKDVIERNHHGIFITEHDEEIITLQRKEVLNKEIILGKMSQVLYYNKNCLPKGSENFFHHMPFNIY